VPFQGTLEDVETGLTLLWLSADDRALDLHDRNERFRLPDPVLDRYRARN